MGIGFIVIRWIYWDFFWIYFQKIPQNHWVVKIKYHTLYEILRTTIIEILDGSREKSIMIGDSESDANAAKAAEIPMILLEDGYTEKNIDEIYHNHLIKDFVGIEKIVSQYL